MQCYPDILSLLRSPTEGDSLSRFGALRWPINSGFSSVTRDLSFNLLPPGRRKVTFHHLYLSRNMIKSSSPNAIPISGFKISKEKSLAYSLEKILDSHSFKNFQSFSIEKHFDKNSAIWHFKTIISHLWNHIDFFRNPIL